MILSHFPFFNWSLAAAATASAVKLNSLSSSFRGADAPNVFMPMIWPVRPV